ncbi:unnamed protein product, partial [Ixodes pacificus]
QVLVPCISVKSLSTSTPHAETINSNLQLVFADKPLLYNSYGLVGNPGHNNPGHGNPGHCNPGIGNPGPGNPGHLNPGQCNPGLGNPGHDNPGHDNPGHHNPAYGIAGRTNPLAILMAWLEAKEAHLQRYRQLYLDQGFDILTVRTHLMQLALPKGGAQRVAQMVLDFLLENPNYARLVVHAFSVGGYQMGEVLVRMRQSGGRYMDLLPRFKAQVYDSPVDVAGTAAGFSIAATKNPLLQKVIQVLMKTQAAVLYPVSTAYHKAASRAFYDNFLTCPALLINSKGDRVSSLEDSIRVADCWRKKGTDVSICTFEDSRHVQHITKYPDQYANEVIRLLRKAQLIA